MPLVAVLHTVAEYYRSSATTPGDGAEPDAAGHDADTDEPVPTRQPPSDRASDGVSPAAAPATSGE